MPSSGTRTAAGPPRRSARRRRAMSTSTRRIICADTPKKCWRFCQRALIPAEQPQTDLVDEPGRLKRDVRSLAGHVPQGHPVQLVVDERHQPIERTLVAIAPEAEQAVTSPPEDAWNGSILERVTALSSCTQTRLVQEGAIVANLQGFACWLALQFQKEIEINRRNPS